jgi:uncharacterized protein YraI
MKSRIFSLLILSILVLAGCNLQSTLANTPTSTPIQADQGQPLVITPTPTNSPILVTPTYTTAPLPTNTPTISLTPTSATAMVTPKTEAVNCRFGPGTSYLSVGGLKVGATVPILGQNGDGTWWQIQNPNNILENCWIAASATTTSGNMASVPVAPTPQPFVTKVTVNTPETISVAGCIGPIAPIVLTGSIDVNGPTAVTYHFETEQGGALPARTLTFTKYGPVNVSDNSYTPPVVAGTYWVKLFVTAPNSVTAEATYTIACP